MSRVVDPKGGVVATAGAEEVVITADVDPEVAIGWRREFPALRDIRFSMSLKQTGN
jgi:predicted amidohydrolase